MVSYAAAVKVQAVYRMHAQRQSYILLRDGERQRAELEAREEDPLGMTFSLLPLCLSASLSLPLSASLCLSASLRLAVRLRLTPACSLALCVPQTISTTILLASHPYCGRV